MTLIASITTVNSSGQTKPNKRVLKFLFSSDFAGTIDGETFSGATDQPLELKAPQGFTLSPVTYTVSAGSIRIVEI